MVEMAEWQQQAERNQDVKAKSVAPDSANQAPEPIVCLFYEVECSLCREAGAEQTFFPVGIAKQGRGNTAATRRFEFKLSVEALGPSE